MKRSTYGKKENSGSFSEEQLKKLSSFLGVKYSELVEAKTNEKIVIDDTMKYIVEMLLVTDTYNRAIWKRLAFLESVLRKEKLEVVRKEYDSHIAKELDAQGRSAKQWSIFYLSVSLHTKV